MAFAEELDHAHALCEGGLRAAGFERLHSRGGEQHAIESEACARCFCESEMGQVRWIEGSSEQADSHLAIVTTRLPE